jgi:hypothetical protein
MIRGTLLEAGWRSQAGRGRITGQSGAKSEATENACGRGASTAAHSVAPDLVKPRTRRGNVPGFYDTEIPNTGSIGMRTPSNPDARGEEDTPCAKLGRRPPCATSL